MLFRSLNSGGSLLTYLVAYNDLFTYQSGIYVPNVTSGVRGTHAMRIIGYGVLNNVEYWITANSWGTKWGEAGFFRARMNNTDLQMETYVYQATMP